MNEEPAGMKSAFQCCRVGGNKHTLVKRKLDLASQQIGRTQDINIWERFQISIFCSFDDIQKVTFILKKFYNS